MQTAVVWTCLRSGQNHLARDSGRWERTRQTEEEMGQHQGMDRPGVHQVPEGSGEQKNVQRKLVVKSSGGSHLHSPPPLRFASYCHMLVQIRI